MVFALLIAAIIWNLGTWWLGLPASSSHTLIGSIIGVGVANSLLHGGGGTSGVDWGKAKDIGMSLLISPLFGFCMAALLLLVLKFVVRNPALYAEPKGKTPPPWWIRSILIATCTGVSFAHGSNDGQKGMGLIMLILIGTVPMAYALNRAPGPDKIVEFKINAAAAAKVIESPGRKLQRPRRPARPVVSAYISERKISEATYPALSGLVRGISAQLEQYGSLAKVPAAAVANTRNDMYLASEGLRFVLKDKANHLSADDCEGADRLQGLRSINATRFIPFWVKVAVALALGLGTMVGWKRIVVTVGEKIGKTHLTYAQGASAELVAAGTIGAADLPRPAVLDHARAVVGGRGHHGRQRLRPAMEHHPQHADRLGADAPGRYPVVWLALFPVLAPVLRRVSLDLPEPSAAEARRHHKMSPPFSLDDAR